MKNKIQKINLEELNPQALLAHFYIFEPEWKSIGRCPCMNSVFVIDGRFRFKMPDGTVLSGEKGDIITYYPTDYAGETYSVAGSESGSLYQVLFYSSPSTRKSVPYIPEYGLIPQKVDASEHIEKCTSFFERIMQALWELQPGWEIEAKAALLELIHFIFRISRKGRMPVQKTLDSWEQLIARIEHRNKDYSINKLAAERGMSTEYFIRQFKKHTGETPKQYITTRRLWKARMLLNEGKPVKDAALESGFNDPLYFSRAFKNKFGFPPSEVPSGEKERIPLRNPQLPVCMNIKAPGVDTKIFEL